MNKLDIDASNVISVLSLAYFKVRVTPLLARHVIDICPACAQMTAKLAWDN